MVAPAAAAPAAAATAATVATMTLPQLIAALQSAGVGAQAPPERTPIFRPALAQGLAAAGPAALGYVARDITEGTPVGSNASSPGGKYLIGGQFDLDRLAYERSELFKRALLGLIPGVGQEIVSKLPPLESTAAAGERVQARQSRAMDEANLREIALRRAEGLLAQQLEGIIQAAQTERTGITEQASTQRQQISSLADIQRQRVESSYGMAKDLLGNTVSGILGTIPTGRPTEVELAKIM